MVWMDLGTYDGLERTHLPLPTHVPSQIFHSTHPFLVNHSTYVETKE